MKLLALCCSLLPRQSQPWGCLLCPSSLTADDNSYAGAIQALPAQPRPHPLISITKISLYSHTCRTSCYLHTALLISLSWPAVSGAPTPSLCPLPHAVAHREEGRPSPTPPPKPHPLSSFVECEAKNRQEGLQELQEKASSSDPASHKPPIKRQWKENLCLCVICVCTRRLSSGLPRRRP